jgi:hypothetical protein
MMEGGLRLDFSLAYVSFFIYLLDQLFSDPQLKYLKAFSSLYQQLFHDLSMQFSFVCPNQCKY